jgi:hypothetical protein
MRVRLAANASTRLSRSIDDAGRLQVLAHPDFRALSRDPADGDTGTIDVG